jgi:hypothetical protein
MGHTITLALHEFPGTPITIEVTGTYNENVSITRDDVTLVAIAGATVNGSNKTAPAILVDGVRTLINSLTVTGGVSGIVVLGEATVENCVAQNSGGAGIVFQFGGHGTVNSCTVEKNPVSGIAIEGGAATVINSTISSNTGPGIAVINSGSARIGITEVMPAVAAGNTISNNGNAGIIVSTGASANIGCNKISGNGTNSSDIIGSDGIGITNNGSADILGSNTITGNRGWGIGADGSTVIIGDPTFGLPIANQISGNGGRGHRHRRYNGVQRLIDHYQFRYNQWQYKLWCTPEPPV